MSDFEVMKAALEERLPHLHGPWVSKRSSYEECCSEALGAVWDDDTHWDCEWLGRKIELKKTSDGSMWFNLLRYRDEVNDDVLTFVLRYTSAPSPHVTTVAVATRAELRLAFDLTNEQWDFLEGLGKALPSGFNPQARLKWEHIRAAAEFIVPCGDSPGAI